MYQEILTQEGLNVVEESSSWVWPFVIALVVVNVLIIRYWNKKQQNSSGRIKPRPKGRFSLDLAETAEALTPVSAQVERARALLLEHKDASFRYELGQEVARRGDRLTVLDLLLDGAEPVLACPVLHLEEVAQDLPLSLRHQTILEAMKVTGVVAEISSQSLRSSVVTAIQNWAKAEAKQRYQAMIDEKKQA